MNECVSYKMDNVITTEVSNCIKCKKPLQIFLLDGEVLPHNNSELGKTCWNCLPESVKKKIKKAPSQLKNKINSVLHISGEELRDDEH